MSWEYVENTSATLSACQWTCEDSTYERDGTTMNCKKKTNQSCSAKTYTYENCSYSILAKNH